MKVQHHAAPLTSRDTDGVPASRRLRKPGPDLVQRPLPVPAPTTP